jgi:predicted nucleic acid-binding protein
VISLHNLARLPSGTRAIIDTNIFVYWVANHPKFGPACRQVIQRVESGDLEAVVPPVVLNELLHRLMIGEVIDQGLAGSVPEAIVRLKEDSSVIPKLSVPWEVYNALPEMGFLLPEQEKGFTDLTYSLSRRFSLMAKDAAIISFAQMHRIQHIISNDRDFGRVPWITCWHP